MILHVTRPHERTKDVVTRRVFESPNTFGGRAPHGPAGGVSALPRPFSRNRAGVLLLRRKEEREKREGRKGRGGDCLLFI